MSAVTRLMVVEDDAQTRAGLVDSLASHAQFEVVAAPGTVKDALAILADDNIAPLDVLLVDLGLPDGSGATVIEAATSQVPPAEVLVITVFGDEKHVISAIEAGAAGYLLKDTAPEGITEAVEQLLAGGSPITPVIARHILKRFQPPPAAAFDGMASKAPASDADGSADSRNSAAEIPNLTPREIEVLQMVSRGYTNNEIGELLSLSFHTVNSHVKHIYRKLAVRSRSEAVFEASQLGIIDLQPGK